MIDEGVHASPAPLPPGKPGDVLATDDLSAPAGARAWRVLYRSTTVTGEPTAVSGLVAAPTTDVRRGIIVFAHGTTGLGDACAPTRRGGVTPYQFGEMLAAGWTVAVTDYQGLGTPGLHHYLVADAAARSVLDAARAAAVLDPAASLDRVALLGFSQGGHAVLSAAERSAELAPEVGLVGVVAAAPAMQLREWFAATPRGQEGYLLMISMAYADAYGHDPAEWLTPTALAHRDEIETGCLSDVLALGSALGPDAFATRAEPGSPAGRLLAENEPGTVAPPAPVLVVTGSEDRLVTPAVADELVRRLCSLGTDVARHEIVGAAHGALSSASREPARQWLDRPSADGEVVVEPCGRAWP